MKNYRTKSLKTYFALDEWKNAETIGITISIPPEVPTVRIIEQAWSEGKEVAVPKCDPEKKTMEFKKISSFNQLESVYYGLLEPVAETAKASKEELDALVVPALLLPKKDIA